MSTTADFEVLMRRNNLSLVKCEPILFKHVSLQSNEAEFNIFKI